MSLEEYSALKEGDLLRYKPKEKEIPLYIVALDPKLDRFLLIRDWPMAAALHFWESGGFHIQEIKYLERIA